MLNMDDRRRLDAIEQQIRSTDPDFANGLRDGIPHTPMGDARGLHIAALTTSLLLCLVGIVALQWAGLLITLPVLAVAIWRYRRHVCRSHRWTKGYHWRPRW